MWCPTRPWPLPWHDRPESVIGCHGTLNSRCQHSSHWPLSSTWPWNYLYRPHTSPSSPGPLSFLCPLICPGSRTGQMWSPLINIFHFRCLLAVLSYICNTGQLVSFMVSSFTFNMIITVILCFLCPGTALIATIHPLLTRPYDDWLTAFLSSYLYTCLQFMIILILMLSTAHQLFTKKHTFVFLVFCMTRNPNATSI